MSPNHNPAVASFECLPGYDSVTHNPTAVLLTCHNPSEKASLETRDFRANVARPNRGVAPRRVSVRSSEYSPRRNPLRGLAIVAGEDVGLGMGARENPTVANFATVGFKWRGQDSNLRPRGYEPRELPGCSTPRQCFGRLGLLLGGSGRSSVWRMNSQEKTQCWSA
jgi:hypothetical protein